MEGKLTFRKEKSTRLSLSLVFNLPPLSNIYIYVKQQLAMFYEHLNIYIHTKDKQLPTRGFVCNIKIGSCTLRIKSAQYVIHG